MKTKEAAAILAVTNLAVNFFAGFVIGAWLGWPVIDTIFMAGVIGMSSSAIAAKSLIDLKRLGNRETEFILGMVILESFLAMFILTLANGMILPAEGPVNIGGLFAGVGLFIGFFALLAAVVVPRTAAIFERIHSDRDEHDRAERGGHPLCDGRRPRHSGESSPLERLRGEVPHALRRNPVHRDELLAADPDGSVRPNRGVPGEATPQVHHIRGGAREADSEDRHHAELPPNLPEEAGVSGRAHRVFGVDHRSHDHDRSGASRDVRPHPNPDLRRVGVGPSRVPGTGAPYELRRRWGTFEPLRDRDVRPADRRRRPGDREPRGDPLAVLLARDPAHPVCLLPRRRVQHEGRVPPPRPRCRPASRTDPPRPSDSSGAELAGRERSSLITGSDTSRRSARTRPRASSRYRGRDTRGSSAEVPGDGGG